MYSNIDNPPRSGILTASPRLNTDRQLMSITRISKLLSLITQARERIRHCQHQYDTHSFLSSPFVSRERWLDDVRRWSYICYRLERYYLKKVCELNSEAYRSLINN
jgi:hypothetical protein